MNGLIDTLWFLRKSGTAEEQLNENRIDKLGEIGNLVKDEF